MWRYMSLPVKEPSLQQRRQPAGGKTAAPSTGSVSATDLGTDCRG